MDLRRADDEQGSRAPEPGFTGDVRIGTLFRREAPSRLAGGTVRFGPGDRTPWKTGPAGQTVVVTAGAGWAQEEGGPVVAVLPGDLLWFPAGRRHWEGGTPVEGMTCVVLHEEVDGVAVRFGDRVTDPEYLRGTASASTGETGSER